jgi:predicted transcriptional regulator
MQIADLRNEMELSLEAFAALVGIQSRGRMSVIERENRCALRVALAIEELSTGRIDAADLCDDVRKARHAVLDIAKPVGVSTGNINDLSGGME